MPAVGEIVIVDEEFVAATDMKEPRKRDTKNTDVSAATIATDNTDFILNYFFRATKPTITPIIRAIVVPA